MTSQPLECTYWFKGYQIDNSDKNILANDFKLRYSDYNAQVLTRLLLGDKSGADETELSDNVNMVKKLIQGYKESGSTPPQPGIYEIITFKQKTNNGSITIDQDSRCIYSIILKKKEAVALDSTNSNANLDTMWLAVFCPRRENTCNEMGCGPFHIWKVNLEGIPNVRLQWYSDVNYTSSNPTPRYCIVSDFKGNGEKPLFGVMGKQGSSEAKFYLSSLSFYLEGRHEDILKKFPKPMDKSSSGRLDGVNIYYLQFNCGDLDPQPN